MHIKSKSSLKSILGITGILAGVAALAVTLYIRQPPAAANANVRPDDKAVIEGRELTKKARDNHAGQLDPTQSSVEEQAQLSAKVAKLESALAKVQAGQTQMNDSDDSMNADGDTLFQTPEEHEEQVELELQAQIDLFQEALKAETEDTEWSSSAVTALYDSVQEIESEGVAIIEADCKSSFCRVHLTLGPGSAEQSLKELENFVPWNGEAFFLVDDLDAGEATVYIAREDHTLPRLYE